MTLHFIKSLSESKDSRELRQDRLKFGKSELDPVMSEATVKYHYDGLAAKYSERYNKGEGDPDFNYGGAVLHNLFFANLTPPRAANKPEGLSKDIINEKHGSFDKFKEAYPELNYKPDHIGQANFDGSRYIHAFFDTVIDKDSNRYLSEDYMFCQWSRKIGIKIWLCPWMKTTHVGTYGFQGDLPAVAALSGNLR